MLAQFLIVLSVGSIAGSAPLPSSPYSHVAAPRKVVSSGQHLRGNANRTVTISNHTHNLKKASAKVITSARIIMNSSHRTSESAARKASQVKPASSALVANHSSKQVGTKTVVIAHAIANSSRMSVNRTVHKKKEAHKATLVATSHALQEAGTRPAVSSHRVTNSSRTVVKTKTAMHKNQTAPAAAKSAPTQTITTPVVNASVNTNFSRLLANIKTAKVSQAHPRTFHVATNQASKRASKSTDVNASVTTNLNRIAGTSKAAFAKSGVQTSRAKNFSGTHFAHPTDSIHLAKVHNASQARHLVAKATSVQHTNKATKKVEFPAPWHAAVMHTGHMVKHTRVSAGQIGEAERVRSPARIKAASKNRSSHLQKQFDTGAAHHKTTSVVSLKKQIAPAPVSAPAVAPGGAPGSAPGPGPAPMSRKLKEFDAKMKLADAHAARADEKAERWLSDADHLIAKAKRNIMEAKQSAAGTAAALANEVAARAKLHEETMEHREARTDHLEAQKKVDNLNSTWVPR